MPNEVTGILTGLLTGLGKSYLDRRDREHEEGRQQAQQQLQYAHMIASDPNATDEGHRFALSTMGTLLGEKDPAILHQAFEQLKTAAGVVPKAATASVDLPGGVDTSAPFSQDENGIPSLPQHAPRHVEDAHPRQGLFYTDEEQRGRENEQLRGRYRVQYEAAAPFKQTELADGIDDKGDVVVNRMDGTGKVTTTPLPGVRPMPGKGNPSNMMMVQAARARIAGGTGTAPDYALVTGEEAKTRSTEARTAYERLRSAYYPQEFGLRARNTAVGETNAATGQRNAANAEANTSMRGAEMGNVQGRFSTKLRADAEGEYAEGLQWEIRANSAENEGKTEEAAGYRAKATQMYESASRKHQQAEQSDSNFQPGAPPAVGARTSPMPSRKGKGAPAKGNPGAQRAEFEKRLRAVGATDEEVAEALKRKFGK